MTSMNFPVTILLYEFLIPQLRNPNFHLTVYKTHSKQELKLKPATNLTYAKTY